MSNVLPVEDLSKTYLEHSMVINNFVIKIGSQIKARFDLGEYRFYMTLRCSQGMISAFRFDLVNAMSYDT